LGEYLDVKANDDLMTTRILGHVDPSCILGNHVIIEVGAVVGRDTRPNRAFAKDTRPILPPTLIEDDCYIGSCVVIERGASIGYGSTIEHGAVIESGVQLGARSYVVHGARLLGNAQIGEDCVIGGLVADRVVVGARCRVFGSLVHLQDKPSTPWDGTIEAAPRLEADVFVGMGARIIGSVLVGRGAYISANTIVTKDVPARHVAIRNNVFVPIDDWEGRLA